MKKVISRNYFKKQWFLFGIINYSFHICTMNEVFTKAIQQQIDDYIKENGLRYDRVAEKAGISRSYLRNIIANRNKLSQKILDKINEALNTNFLLP